jgi:hypothetical protein
VVHGVDPTTYSVVDFGAGKIGRMVVAAVVREPFRS